MAVGKVRSSPPSHQQQQQQQTISRTPGAGAAGSRSPGSPTRATVPCAKACSFGGRASSGLDLCASPRMLRIQQATHERAGLVGAHVCQAGRRRCRRKAARWSAARSLGPSSQSLTSRARWSSSFTEQASLKGQEGYQEKGHRPFHPQGFVIPPCPLVTAHGELS